jgi:hypothetical protein
MKNLFLKKNLKIDNGLQCPGCGKEWSGKEWSITEKEPALRARFKRVMGFSWPANAKVHGVPLKQDYEQLRLDTKGVPKTLYLCLRCSVGYLKELTGELWRIHQKADVEFSMRWERLYELGVAVVVSPHLPAEMWQELADVGVLQIDGEFNCHGDEARIESLEVTEPENVELPTDLATELEDLLMEEIVVNGTDEDYYGSIVVDVGSGKVTIYCSSDVFPGGESD